MLARLLGPITELLEKIIVHVDMRDSDKSVMWSY